MNLSIMLGSYRLTSRPDLSHTKVWEPNQFLVMPFREQLEHNKKHVEGFKDYEVIPPICRMIVA